MLLHVFTAAVYYGVWLLAYLFYNSFMNLPAMTAAQVLQNLWHNILFYIQGFSFLHLFHYFRQREAQAQREKELRQIAYETEIAGLKAQIQPHFFSIRSIVSVDQYRRNRSSPVSLLPGWRIFSGMR